MNLELLLPELCLVGFAIALVVVDFFTQRRATLVVVALAGLAVSAGFAVAMWGSSAQTAFNDMLAVDNFAIFFKLLFLGIAALVILATVDYTPKFARFKSEFHVLVLLSTLGMMLMAATTELISLFVALELTSISLYALVGFLKDRKSIEASLKYLLLGAIASAVLLYGMALIFGFTGKTHLGEIAQAIQAISPQSALGSPGLILGVALLVAGFGFKIAAVPFHMWVPDVYEGAPTPITAYLSVASKAAGFAIILRVFFTAFGSPGWLSMDWGLLFAALAVMGMLVGNISALPQTNIKRMLGYSSIAQAGYLLVGVATMGVASADSIVGQSVVIFFLVSYALTNLGAFTAIIAISNKVKSDLIKDYAGMGKRAPLLSLALTLCLISLIGMPPAAGFMAKFFIFSTAVNQGLLWLVIIAVINSVISAYYYLRVVKVMWLGEPTSEEKIPSSGALKVALSLSCLGVLLLGIIPGSAMKLAEFAARMFSF
ncbi:NADH-quinone oxidoreductase subunit N [Chloroflexota bacterium]